MDNDQRIAEITRIMNTVERTRAKLQSENQCYTCALGSHDECGDYCEKAADDYECEDEGCSNFKDGTPSYAKIDEDDLGTLFDYIPFLLSQLAAKDAEIERLREAQRWRDVETEPPQYTGDYNVLCNIGSMLGGYTDVRTYRYERIKGREPKWCIPNRFDEVVGITHWMPLPAAPEKGARP